MINLTMGYKILLSALNTWDFISKSNPQNLYFKQ